MGFITNEDCMKEGVATACEHPARRVCEGMCKKMDMSCCDMGECKEGMEYCCSMQSYDDVMVQQAMVEACSDYMETCGYSFEESESGEGSGNRRLLSPSRRLESWDESGSGSGEGDDDFWMCVMHSAKEAREDGKECMMAQR